MKKIKGFLGKPLVRGILKEAVSYVPVVGDTIANKIENEIGTGVTVVDPKSQQYQEIAGKVIIGGLVVAFISGWLSMEDLKELVSLF